MTTSTPVPARGEDSPVRIQARTDEHLSRGLWLVKWLLLVPHLVVLGVLGVAFWVLTVVALFAVLVTGRYPRTMFAYNVGVLRWGWRVTWYGYGGLGTDRYPRFALDDRPDDAARLDIAYPGRLSRGLVLVKWWLLALPHYLVLALLVGAGGTIVGRVGGGGAFGTEGGGLLSLLVLFVGVLLLFTGRYPAGLLDLVTGIDRWVLRVVAYAALMTDSYPPMRLDQGPQDPAGPLPGDGPDRTTAAPAAGAAEGRGGQALLTRHEAPPARVAAAPLAPPPAGRAVLLTAGAWALLLGLAGGVAGVVDTTGTGSVTGATGPGATAVALVAGGVLALAGAVLIAVGARPVGGEGGRR
ncbi:DUF4389 domain-containing protein [Pseudonocardia sp. DR1-2]|uniref:DUF4389 domain-containing protein n=1 Tax=Pseudonocardia sp. DR1-2 TaxID=2951168 RepID=UPI0027E34A01|nr:DUF4389 domain-containing protein [Pseudonocardia sp. DR1-2]